MMDRLAWQAQLHVRLNGRANETINNTSVQVLGTVRRSRVFNRASNNEYSCLRNILFVDVFPKANEPFSNPLKRPATAA
jgi:hypothetical protein